jgi:hypothetical protein
MSQRRESVAIPRIAITRIILRNPRDIPIVD